MLSTLSMAGAEPVQLADAKLAARVDGVALDAFIQGAISAAREQAEQITGRIYRLRVQRAQFVDWPSADVCIPVFGPNGVAVSYWNGAAWVGMANGSFLFFQLGTGTGVAPAVNAAWPALGAIAGGSRVRVDLTSGPAGTDGEVPVPECVKLYIKACVSGWVNNGDALVSGQLQANPMLDRLLSSERLWA